MHEPFDFRPDETPEPEPISLRELLHAGWNLLLLGLLGIALCAFVAGLYVIFGNDPGGVN